MNNWNEPIDALVASLRERGLQRAAITMDSAGSLQVSDEALRPLADAISAEPDFRDHAGCFFEIGASSGHLLSAFIHRTERGQGAGGVRFWTYATTADLVRDGLRLSRAMGQKNALAGIWWGGGKGIIARRAGLNYDNAHQREAVFTDYGRFISGLSGCYITAEDVGTRPHDMAAIFSATRHTTCIPPAFGGSGNPAIYTARGVVVAMEAVLEHHGRGSLAGKTVAMQGIGNVAGQMAFELIQRGVGRIVACDIDEVAVRAAKERFANDPIDISLCEKGDLAILASDCDILAPNAVGGVINAKTIPSIRAPIVCGAANNQLQEMPSDALALQQQGVTYVPDFLANRMGIVNCANEQYGVIEGDPAIAAHLDRDNPQGIYRRVIDVLNRSAESGRPPAVEAELLADELAGELHPIWGNRGQDIINALVNTEWAAHRPY